LDSYESLAIVVATLNRADKLNARLESRFPDKWMFDLPCAMERKEIAEIHLRALGAADPVGAADLICHETEGFSAREIATQLVPAILRLSNRAPNGDVVRQAAREILPTSKSQSEQLDLMRRAAAGFRPAGRSGPAPTGPSRRVG
jgi:AAA+ superfamily predicted ATPase